MKNKTEIPAAEAAHAAKQASFALAAAPGKARSSALLAVAAVAEVYVTPHVMALFM